MTSARNIKYNTEEIRQKDKQHQIHPWTDFSTFEETGSLVIAESEGCYVYDSDGNRFLDGIAGLWCVNVGYGRDEIAQAMADQARRMVTTSARSKCAVNTAYSLSPTRW